MKLLVDPDRLYDFADPAPGNTQSLRNAPAGSARVLWVEPTGSVARWTVVRLGDGEDQLRFKLLAPLSRCGSALAQLLLFRDGRWTASCRSS